MLRLRDRRRSVSSASAVRRLALIEVSIGVLENEDLLDLADILRSQNTTPLAVMVSANMLKRNIRL